MTIINTPSEFYSLLKRADATTASFEMKSFCECMEIYRGMCMCPEKTQKQVECDLKYKNILNGFIHQIQSHILKVDSRFEFKYKGKSVRTI